MPSFPALKTGAVAQYPAKRQIRFSTQVVEFIDGTEQRFREYTQALRRWVIRLDLLDATEVQALATFFDSVGPVSPFSFTDPWDGSIHPNCVIEGGEFTAEWLDEFNGRTELTIRENRT
jgi:FAD/FMN-containing dehydrogenase